MVYKNIKVGEYGVYICAWEHINVRIVSMHMKQLRTNTL